MTVWSYPYEGEDHGDGQADRRWRLALTREAAVQDMDAIERHASEAGFPLSDVPKRIQTPVDRFLDPLVSVDELLADIAKNGA